MNLKEKGRIGWEYVLIILSGVLLAVDYTLFIVPNGFAPAGINGIAVMVQYKLGFSIGYMSLLINIPLCVISFFVLQKKFAVRTLLFCLTYSFSYLFLQGRPELIPFQYNAGNVDTIYPVIIAGLLSGLIYSILLKRSACSGGTDIISRFVLTRHPDMNFFWIIFILNAIVAAVSYFVYAENIGGSIVYNYKPVCLCILYCFTSSFVGDALIKGNKEACEFIVVTDQAEEIEKEIITEFHHSATRIQGTGIYENNEKTVLLCIVNKHQIAEFENMIRKYPHTFVIEQMVSGTVGNFKKVK